MADKRKKPNLRIVQPRTDVRETLLECISEADEMAGLMVVGVTRDGRPFVKSSSMELEKKTLIVAIMNSWCQSQFVFE